MICEKVFTCSVADVDSVVLELAEEIKKGWTIGQIECLDIHATASMEVQPCCKIKLRRKKS